MMNFRKIAIPGLLLLAPFAVLHPAELKLTAPLDYQVVQRSSADKGTIRIVGSLAEPGTGKATVEARLVGGESGAWKALPGTLNGTRFTAGIAAPAGGWYGLDVRVMDGGKLLAEGSVEHVGVGEIFVVAGQSNSANWGEKKLTTQSGRVTTFDGKHWQLSVDPQPGAGGTRGSFLPPFGDAMVERFMVPVGFISCGVGASSVRDWLPKGTVFPNPGTLTGWSLKQPNGDWVSKGDIFSMFSGRMKALGPHGFRAVLWHQGESDANQQDPANTLSGKLYREYLEKVIHQSNVIIGWDAPWFVAQVSYHVPGDESSPEIREAQASLWKDGVAQEGPDTDALTGRYRENNGMGVHMSAEGQYAHAARWVEKVAPWLDEELK